MNVAILGAGGYWGSKIARVFNEHKEFTLSTIVEPNGLTHDDLRKKYPDATLWTELPFSSIKEDIVAIVTPAETHFELCKQALLASKHVWITKPFVLSYSEADELYGIANQMGKTIFVDYTFMFNAGVMGLHSQLAKVGTIKSIFSNRSGWGLYNNKVCVIEDLMPHDLSIIRQLLGNKFSLSVDNLVCNKLLNTEIDSVYLQGVLSNSKQTINLQIINSWASPVKSRFFSIVGTKGALVFDDMQAEKIKFYDKTIKYQKNKFIYNEKPTITFTLDGKESLAKEMEEYFLFLHDKKYQKYYNDLNLQIVKDLEAVITRKACQK